MRLALITENFPPLRNSGAVQLRDLAREFSRQGHELTVLLPSSDLHDSWELDEADGFQVVRLKAPRTKDIGYVRRTFCELVMPFFMLRQFRKSPLIREKWDGVIWYAPSIFHGPLASALKKSSGCKGYLIIRDIFPEWAVDMGLMKRGLLYRFFDAIARYQYSVADVIGVQTPGNIGYFERWQQQSGRKLEVLHNWLGESPHIPSPICIDKTALAGRKVFIYAGNMGVAQGMTIFIDLAEQLRKRIDVGFLFVGRGSHLTHLKASAKDRKLDNVLFFDEIDPDEISSLYAQCIAGIVALDTRHKSHNIPGKFLTYMQSGLPVLANVNSGNDLAQMIRDEQVGHVCENNQLDDLVQFANKLLLQIESDEHLSARCRSLFQKKFTVEKTVFQLVSALSVRK